MPCQEPSSDGEASIYAVTDDLSMEVDVGSLPTKASSTCDIVGTHLSCIPLLVTVILPVIELLALTRHLDLLSLVLTRTLKD